MSAEAFVKLANSYGLINAARMEKILNQISSAAKPVSAEKIASALVKKDLLTNDEANRLLATLKNPPPAQLPGPPELEPLEAELEVIDDDSPEPPPVAELEEVAVFQGSSRSIPPRNAESRAPAVDTSDDDDLYSSAASPPRPRRKKGLLAKLGLGNSSGKRSNQWDSPLMLVGGGVLLFMLIGGAGLGWFLTRETGEQVFATAEEDYRAQKYTNAISKYQRFLDKFPSHPDASTARVRVSMSRIRQDVESRSDWERALQTTARELPTIKSEPAFNVEGRPDLSSLLPTIYAGFIDDAENSSDAAEKQHFLDKSTEALALIDNPEYLPGSLRKNVQLDIERTNEKATLIVREINRDKELTTAVEKIKQATAEKDTTAAYAARSDLLSRYPGLATHEDLVAAVQEITGAERARVVVSAQGLSAESTDHPPKVPNKVAVADRKTKKKTGITDRSIYALASGALYGLNADDGSVLWRRWLGYANPIQPKPINSEPGADALAFDDKRQELLRLSASNGKLVWRLPLGEFIAEPVVTDDQVAIATSSGKLALIDSIDGTAAPIAQLPQKLITGPGIDSQRGRIYQVGQHSSLYVLAADTLECSDVAYVGHRPNSVKVPAVPIAGHVFVAENRGDFCWLHVLVGDSNGTNLRPAMQKIRLNGEINVPMQRFGRRLLVVTDNGAMHVYNIDPSNTGQPVSEIAKTLPTGRTKRTTYPLVSSGQVFVAGDKIARFELQAARGELVRKWVDESDEVYVAPPRLHKNVLFTVRRNPKSSATKISATHVTSGRNQQGEGEAYWTTEVGAQPSKGAHYDSKRAAITIVSNDGDIWDIGGRHIKAGKNDSAAADAADARLHVAATTRDGRVTFAPSANGQNLIVVDPTAKKRSQDIPLPISKPEPSTRPVPIGDKFLVCSSTGTIHAIDSSGSETLLPFQPSLSAGSSVRWLAPSVVDDATQTFVAANSDGIVYLVAPNPNPTPHLSARLTKDLGVSLTGNLAIVGDRVLAVSHDAAIRNGAATEIRVLGLPNLDLQTTIPLDGRVTWGPMRIESANGTDLALITTSANQLHAINADGTMAWSAPLTYGSLAGKPFNTGRSLILASVHGHVWQVALATGKALPWSANQTHFDVGEPLGAGAFVFSKKLLLLGRDSTLFMTDPPQSAATASR